MHRGACVHAVSDAFMTDGRLGSRVSRVACISLSVRRLLATVAAATTLLGLSLKVRMTRSATAATCNVSGKKGAALFLALTLPNAKRFSNSFHRQI